jgi:16S rRNA (guanine(966)-N(2))-methyltransferase RsmD
VRILRGKWRGRSIPFVGAPQTRPLSERAREGLFNSLETRTTLAGKTVIDLFAGSGAVGLEFLSRGAAFCTFVEKDPRLITYLKHLAETWDLTKYVQIIQNDVIAFLQVPPKPADFIYIGAPYRYWQRKTVLSLIRTRGWLNPGGYCILEHPLYESYTDWEGFVHSARYLSGCLSFFTW